MTNTSSDYWSILKIAPGADDASIKRAFREQAREWHPDLNKNDPESEERFKQINEAYAVLSDQKRRSEWEQSYLRDYIYSQGADFFNSGFPSFQSYLQIYLGYFDEKRSYIAREVDWEERQDFRYQTIDFIPSDSYQSNNWMTSEEMIVNLTPDQAVHGSVIEIKLADGSSIDVETPPLAGHGWRLRLPEVGQGGIDEFLQLRIETEEGLQVDGLTVVYILEILPADAALGCVVSVPTLTSYANIEIPDCSSSGDLLILQGEGLIQGNKRGDQIVEIKIILPNEINERERRIYTELQTIDSKLKTSHED
uniref:DnaJ protein n=1 Tax=Paulinella longichromatophora TaxID=1708747 RepID=A0A2H4ZNU3_9EUKA|nr:DnaJ protein [Paulinella longichromatophora]